MLKRLRLINFRRYKKLEFTFDQHLNIIEGENNAGKTTIFMGIEYALFGTVSGFRSQAELAHPETDEIGAELIYLGIDGKTYKLQRTHVIGSRGKSKRGASGYYTLKEIEPNGEKYLLSSDFPDNPEEMLQLKIFETFGISKRLFNIAINVKQGEISEILQGKSDLDIVLGVSASKIAEKSTRQLALGYEKETSQYNNLKNSKETISAEKTQLERQKQQLDSQKNDIQESITKLSGQQNNFSDLNSIIENFQQRFEETFDDGEEWESNISNYRSLHKAHKKLLEIPLDQLEQKIEELKGKEIIAQKVINDGYDKEGDLTEQLKQFNQKLGDIQGKLSRRRKVSGIAKCEVCGAEIDSEQVKKDISEWEDELSQTEAQITVLNAQMSQLKSEINNSRSNLNMISTEIQRYKLNIDQIKKSEQELESQIPLLKELTEKFTNSYRRLKADETQYTTDITKWIETFGNDDELKENLLLSPIELEDEKSVTYHTFEVNGETISSFLSLNDYNDQIAKIQETKIKMSASLDAKISGERSRLSDLNNMSKDIDPRIKRLEREIVALEEEIIKLNKKRQAAIKLRALSKGFKKLTTRLRNESAKQLAELTWKYHKDLSGIDEYLSLSIDPKNYGLLIRPKDIDEEVPAYYYQGGGHKLLLGLAYKFAISHLVTKPTYYLLDEPTYGLDNENKQKLLNNIQELAKTVQMNLITHQREQLEIKGKLVKILKEERSSKMEVVS